MSSEPAAAPPTAEQLHLRDRVLNLYAAVFVITLATMALAAVYTLRLGPVVGPGVEESFGLALALLFLSAALLFHIVDRTYRVWPLGRSVPAPFPGLVTERGWLNLLKVLVIAGAAAGAAYVLTPLVTG